MSTFLRVIGALSFIGSLFAGLVMMMGSAASGSAFTAVFSGIITCVVFWWMAAMLDAARASEGNLEAVYEAIRGMVKWHADADLAAEGAATLAAGMRVRHPALGDGKLISTDGVRASVIFDGRETEELVDAAHLRRTP